MKEKTYPDYIRNYRNALEARKYPGNTIEAYSCALLTMCSRLNKTPEQIGKRTLENYVTGIKSVSHHKQTVGSFAKYFEVVLGRTINTSFLPRPRPEHRIPDILTPQECYKIFMCIENPKHRSEIQTGYTAALRISEISHIKIKDITGGEKPILKVRKAKGTKDRMVPISPELITLWKTYLKKYPIENMTGESWLFPGQFKGEHISNKSISNVLEAAVKRAGILKHVTIHTLRHSRATHWHNAGVDIYTIKELLGHKNIRTTEIYLHTGVEDVMDRLTIADQLIKMKVNYQPIPVPQKQIAAYS